MDVRLPQTDFENGGTNIGVGAVQFLGGASHIAVVNSQSQDWDPTGASLLLSGAGRFVTAQYSTDSISYMYVANNTTVNAGPPATCNPAVDCNEGEQILAVGPTSFYTELTPTSVTGGAVIGFARSPGTAGVDLCEDPCRNRGRTDAGRT